MNRFLFLIVLIIICNSSAAQNIIFSKKFVKLESTSANTQSAPDTVVVQINSFVNNLNVKTTFPFEVSIDGLNFSDSLMVSNPVSNVDIPLYFTIIPNAPDAVYRSVVKFYDGNSLLNDKVYLVGTSISASASISFCTWNMKWFGLPTQCNCDTALARKNVTSIMSEIDADIYALQEVGTIATLQKVVSDLGSQYDYVVSDYCSQINDSASSGYANCQKLAYVFNKNKIAKQDVFGLLRSTYPQLQGNGSPHNYFASGRWPYVFSATIPNVLDTFRFVNIHAKAFAGTAEHNRRAGGAVSMADSLNALFPNDKIIIVGDYNDKIEGAISSGFTVSPYDYLFTNGFQGITKPSLFPGQATYIGSNASIIDNVVLSNMANTDYISNSTIILSELDLAIDNYKNTTSDHLPVLSFLKLNGSTSVNNFAAPDEFLLVQPIGKTLVIKGLSNYYEKLNIKVFSMEGKKLFAKSFYGQSHIEHSFEDLPKGVYIVTIESEGVREVKKWLVN